MGQFPAWWTAALCRPARGWTGPQRPCAALSCHPYRVLVLRRYLSSLPCFRRSWLLSQSLLILVIAVGCYSPTWWLISQSLWRHLFRTILHGCRHKKEIINKQIMTRILSVLVPFPVSMSAASLEAAGMSPKWLFVPYCRCLILTWNHWKAFWAIIIVYTGHNSLFHY